MDKQFLKLFYIIVIANLFFLESCALFKPRTEQEVNSKGVNFNNKTVREIITTAKDYKGTPYKYGGTTRSGMDCSGLVTVAFNAVNLKLPRSSVDMAKVGKEVSMRNLRPGDLVFFTTGKEDKISHVGIVTEVKALNNILFIHAADSGVKEDNLFAPYYQKTFTKAMRPF